MKNPFKKENGTTQGRYSFNFWTIVIFSISIFFLIFIVYPFGKMVINSFVDKTGTVGFSNYIRFFTKKYYQTALFNSMKVCLMTTVLAVLIGVPMAYVVSRFNVWAKRLINMLVVISLMSPPFIGAYSWITLLGKNGLVTKLLAGLGINIGSIYGFKGIVLVFVLKLYPFVYMYVSGALKNFDASLDEASENLGVSGIQKLMKVTFPLILPTITASALMVFMNALADYGTPRLIGQGYRTLPVTIFEEYLSEVSTNASFACTLSVIIVICSLAVLFLQRAVVSRRNYSMNMTRPPEVKKLSLPKRILATVICLLIALLGVTPQITVLVQSFMKTKSVSFIPVFTLENYKTAFTKVGRNIINTYVFAIVALVIMIVLAVLVSYMLVRRRSRVSKILDSIAVFPYVIPGSVVGIALLTAFNRKPLVLTGTAFIIILSLTLRRLQYTLRSSTSILYQIDGSVDEASISLGMSPMKTFFKVTLQLMLPGVLSGAMLSFVSSINELSSSLMLYAGKTGTIAVAIFTEIDHDGYGTGSALASLLVVTTVVVLLIFDKVTGGKSVIGN